MKKCPVCNNDNNDYANQCIVCGTQFNKNNANSMQNNNTSNLPDNQQEYNQNIQNTSQFNARTLPQDSQENIPQMQQNHYPNQQFPPNIPRNKKSKLVGLILNMLIVGLGYAYVGKWGEGLILLVIYVIMFLLGFILIFPWIIALIIWIYSLFKTNNMIDRYNQGLPY